MSDGRIDPVDLLRLPEVLREGAREVAKGFPMRTHSESCWQWHLPCAAQVAADYIEELEAQLAD